jgi:hypothetical protein
VALVLALAVAVAMVVAAVPVATGLHTIANLLVVGTLQKLRLK